MLICTLHMQDGLQYGHQFYSLYPIYELKVSIDLLFLKNAYCHPKILKPSLIIKKTNENHVMFLGLTQRSKSSSTKPKMKPIWWW
jgi:hypothetical protein